MTRGAAVAGALVVCVGLAAGLTGRGVKRQLEIGAVCDAAAAQRWDEVLASSAALTGPDPDGRYAAECRCWALLATERGAECDALLDDLISIAEGVDAPSQWIPDASLAVRVVERRLGDGRFDEALKLAQRAFAEHPTDWSLAVEVVRAMSARDGEDEALARLDRDLRRGELPTGLQLALADFHERRADPSNALRVLDSHGLPSDAAWRPDWFEARALALANLDRLAGVKRVYESWREVGGDSVELRARYALRLSRSGLAEPGSSWRELLRRSLAERTQLTPPDSLERDLVERLIAHLLADGEVEEALRVYDSARIAPEAVAREDIVRSRVDSLVPDPDGLVSRVAFRVPLAGARLFVSPSPAAALDSDYEVFEIADPNATIFVERELSAWPVRWVVRDADGEVRASGSRWPLRDRVVAVEVALRDPAPRPVAERPRTRAGDGRRRLFSVVLDCGDWRIVQYLRARGEIQHLDAMLREGYRAVLESSPPLTAAAMESLVWPARGSRVSLVGLVHRLGLELSGLASVGENPVDFLAGLLPEGESLFEAVAGAGRLTANMLFAHGGIAAGRHAEWIGPDGERTRGLVSQAFRPLTEADLARHPELEVPRARRRAEEIASQMDTALQLAREGRVDLLMLRLESLDLLTHAHYGELARGGQDDGRRVLLAAYRYVDERLAELAAELDADDILIVMSDHGIRSPMEHAPDALFAVTGLGIPRGRAPGTPALAGVSKVIADLLGVRTAWPESGVAPWLDVAGSPGRI